MHRRIELTAEEKEWAINPGSLRLEGCLLLVGHVIDQAVSDYKELRRVGAITSDNKLDESFVVLKTYYRDGKPPQTRRLLRRGVVGYKYIAEVESLIHFFREGGGLDQWVDLAGFTLIHPDAIRRVIRDSSNASSHRKCLQVPNSGN
ncbi:MAG: hypothetical protein KGL39_60435 [Patescibacteria group bacterium]|nr:hypothetical protein [Patescibacteria group bacterium]